LWLLYEHDAANHNVDECVHVSLKEVSKNDLSFIGGFEFIHRTPHRFRVVAAVLEHSHQDLSKAQK
jgi:hypothetical protein